MSGTKGLCLAFDATGAGLRVVIGAPDRMMGQERRPGPRGQVEDLAPAIAACLAAAGLGWADVGRIGVVRGPGSFVGVRVGVAAARGLALATGIETVGLDGFDATAETARLRGARGARIAAAFGAGDRLVWRDYALDDAAAHPLGELQSGDRAALTNRDVASVGPGVDADWPGADPAALLALTRAASPAEAPIRPLYARAPDATPSSRRPAPRL